MFAAPKKMKKQIDYNKKIAVKFKFRGFQRKRYLKIGELNYHNLVAKGKTLLKEKDQDIKIFKDENFSEEYTIEDFSSISQYYHLKSIPVFIKVVVPPIRIEVVEEEEKEEEKVEVEKFAHKPKFEKYGEEALNKNEEKLLEVFDFLMKQNLVKKFIKKKAEFLNKEDNLMPEDQKKDIMITVLANVFQNSNK